MERSSVSARARSSAEVTPPPGYERQTCRHKKREKYNANEKKKKKAGVTRKRSRMMQLSRTASGFGVRKEPSRIEVLLQQKVSPSSSFLTCRSFRTRLCVCSYSVRVNEAMLSFRITCLSSVIPTLVCSQKTTENATIIRLYITTRWRRVFCSGSSVCRTRCWLAAALALSPRSPAASAPAAAGSVPPSAPDSGSGSTATQGKKWAERCQIIGWFSFNFPARAGLFSHQCENVVR